MAHVLIIATLLIIIAGNASGACHFGCLRYCASNDECLVTCKTGYSGRKCDKCNWCAGDACDIYGFCNGTCKGNLRHGLRCDTLCPTHCKDNMCNMWDGSCTNGCERGYEGSKCDNCTERYYKKGIRCYECPSSCQTCTDYNNCNICKEGLYGAACITRCPSNCINSICDKTSGNCTDGCVTGHTGFQCESCAERYFKYASVCYECPNNCQKCTNDSDCKTCKTNFYGTLCRKSCPKNCLNNLCDKSNGICSDGCIIGYAGNECNVCATGYYLSSDEFSAGCLKCQSYCQKCSQYSCEICSNNSFYGSNCQHPCSFGCQYGICHKDSGTCSCKPGYKGENCNNCSDGYFESAKTCTQCPLHCASCSSSTDCFSCATSYYGNTCQSSCSAGCKFASCKPSDGSCECRDGYTSNNCTQCIAGMYGDKCDMDCPNTCITCSSKNSCDNCEIGYYGQACGFSCSEGCNGTCIKTSGTCNVCFEGYSGDKCCVQNANCKMCSTTKVCSVCEAGYYGTKCESSCPNNCIGSCLKNSGDCKTCVDGYYGLKCENGCSGNCLSCFTDGSCITCKNGFYGTDTNCLYSCPEHCSTCVSNTNCTLCKDGYFGTNTVCSRKCPANCAKCSSDIRCTHCANGYTGITCSNTCDMACNTCLIGNSTLCTSCKRGYFAITHGLTDFLCERECSAYCLNGFCENDSGICTEGCVNGYTGKRCRCPDNCRDRYCQNYECYESNCNAGFIGFHCKCSQGACTDMSCSSCHNDTWYVSVDGICCKCPSTCRDNICSADKKCTKGCIDGFYGDKCQHRCLDKDIWCLTCTDSLCGRCLPGYFPANGECIKCFTSCINGMCNASNGICVEGCHKGFWGDDCSQQCSQHCKTCDRYDGKCFVCENKRYGWNCSFKCGDRCLTSANNTTCDIDDGSCNIGCTNNMVHGAMCHLICNTTCSGQTCDWKTGKCTTGCSVGYHGEWCENRCSGNCIDLPGNRSCDSSNGTCHVGCKNGFYRHDCQARCGANCINETCERETGACTLGCSDGFDGSDCSKALGQSGGNNTGMVVGSGAGGAVFILLIAAVLVVVQFMRQRRAKKVNKANFRTVEKESQAHIAMDDVGQNYTNSTAACTVQRSSMQSTNMNSEPSNFNNATYQDHAPHLSLIDTLSLESDQDTKDTLEAIRSHYIDAPNNLPKPCANRLAVPIIAPNRQHLDPPYMGDNDGDTYYNATAIRRVAVDRLADYVANKSDEDFHQEFVSFPKGLVRPYAVSQMPGNVKRNRYNKVYPYDENRVKLQNSASDYINASYIDGFERKNEYIAALGPTRDTTNNFSTVWSMIWQQKVEKIVMLTNLQEGLRMKCHQYWPNPGEGETYGDVTVTCMAEDKYAEYTVRTLSATKNKEKRVIYHLHYTGWPDRGVPDDVTGLIEFRNKVLRVKATLDGPVLVHCSAGVGRTGTYIALDYLTNEGEETESVDVFDCVSSLRQQRIWMVQAEEQYVYLHDAVVHTLTFDSHPIQSDKFLENVKSLTPANLDRMYSHLKSGHRQKDEKEVKAVAKNKTCKNTNNPAADIPGDRYRPRIHLSRTQGECDYINAVYLNSFWFRNHYIAAQTPLTSTVDDFLTLLFQEHIPCIVDMQPNHSKQKNIGEYLPADNQKITPHRDFAIRIIKVKSNTQFTFRRLIITRNSMQGPEERTFHHYQFVAWQDNEPTPPSPEDFINFVREVEAKSKEDFDDAKILVHCLTGAGRSCLFPAVSVMLQKMESEQEVSVVNTVRQIQSRRPSAIPDKEQYLFCHECIRVFLDSVDTYSNFAMR